MQLRRIDGWLLRLGAVLPESANLLSETRSAAIATIAGVTGPTAWNLQVAEALRLYKRAAAHASAAVEAAKRRGAA